MTDTYSCDEPLSFDFQIYDRSGWLRETQVPAATAAIAIVKVTRQLADGEFAVGSRTSGKGGP